MLPISPASRTRIAASARGHSAKSLKNAIASSKLDLPTPFTPAMQVKGPKRTSTSTRFLNPDTFNRVNMTNSPVLAKFISRKVFLSLDRVSCRFLACKLYSHRCSFVYAVIYMANSVRLPKFTISARAATRLKAGHVWVYESDITGKPKASPGALVQVVDPREKPLGSALYSSSSQIALRLITPEHLSGESDLMRIVRQRLEEAVTYRRMMVREANAYRVVFSEGDRLPGLVIDRYNDVYTLQTLTQAWDQDDRKQVIMSYLREFTGAEHIVERAGARIRELEQLPEMESKQIHGDRSKTIVELNGVKFHTDTLGGQKTGGFLDQRENYAAAARYSRGEALDVCTYQGGFALHLARA